MRPSPPFARMRSPAPKGQRVGARSVPKEERLFHRAGCGLRRRDRGQSQTQRGELSCKRGLSCGRAQTRHARSRGEDAPVVALLSDARLAEKTMNAVHEVCSRGARVFLITTLSSCAEGCCPKRTSCACPRARQSFRPYVPSFRSSSLPMKRRCCWGTIPISRAILPRASRWSEGFRRA